MTQRLLLLAPLVLVGCLSASLWRADRGAVEMTARGEATMAALAVGVAPGEPGPEPVFLFADAGAEEGDEVEEQLAVRVGRAVGRAVTSPWAKDPVQNLYLLELEGKGRARAVVDLLTGEVLGPIDRCAIELDWTMDPHQSASWSGRIDVRGTFSPALQHCDLERDAACLLLASAAALPVDATGDAELQRCAAAVATIDWRALRPLMANGAGRALAFVPRSGAPVAGASLTGAPRLADLDVVVSVGSAESARFLRVPAAAVSPLTAVGHDPSTLCARFALSWRCRPRPPRALDLALQPLRCQGEVLLVTRILEEGHYYGWFTRNVLIRITDAIDWVLGLVWELLVGEEFRPPREPHRPRRG